MRIGPESTAGFVVVTVPARVPPPPLLWDIPSGCGLFTGVPDSHGVGSVLCDGRCGRRASWCRFCVSGAQSLAHWGLCWLLRGSLCGLCCPLPSAFWSSTACPPSPPPCAPGAPNGAFPQPLCPPAPNHRCVTPWAPCYPSPVGGGGEHTPNFTVLGMLPWEALPTPAWGGRRRGSSSSTYEQRVHCPTLASLLCRGGGGGAGVH